MPLRPGHKRPFCEKKGFRKGGNSRPAPSYRPTEHQRFVVDGRAVIEGLVILGEQPKLRRFIGTGAVALWEIFRFTQTIAVSAAAARQWEAAEDHLQIAMQQAESFPYCLEQAEITPLPRNDADRSRRVDLGLEIRLLRS
jgi:hypothetical protein